MYDAWILEVYRPFFETVMESLFDLFSSPFFWVLWTPVLLLLPLKIILSLCNK